MVSPSFYLEFGNRFSFWNVFLHTFDDGQNPKTWFFKMYLPAERLLDSSQCLFHTIAPRDITPHEFLVTAFVWLSRQIQAQGRGSCTTVWQPHNATLADGTDYLWALAANPSALLYTELTFHSNHVTCSRELYSLDMNDFSAFSWSL
jgi:hypothetical protein